MYFSKKEKLIQRIFSFSIFLKKSKFQLFIDISLLIFLRLQPASRYEIFSIVHFRPIYAMYVAFDW